MKLAIEKVIVGGQGLARVPESTERTGGMRVFVPFTLAGEIVEAEIVERHRGYCIAESLAVERASPFRAQPPCPWFGACGGCQLQHSVYSYQAEMKREMLAESLARAGVRELPPISAIAGEPLGYRNRVRLQVQTLPDFAVGYRQTKSHRMTAVDACPIAAPLLDRCIFIAKLFGQQGKFPVELQEIGLFTNRDQSELLATFWVRPRAKVEQEKWRQLLQEVRQQVPQLIGAEIFAAEKGKSHAARPLMQWGKSSLRFAVLGRQYTVSNGSFFQVNSTVLDAFLEAVVDGASGRCAWDLYSGVGLFSLPLAENFERVVAVESNPSACKDFRANLQGKNARLVSSTALDFLKGSVERPGTAPDLVVLDPPRAGLGVEGCGLLAQCNPDRIVYVSCDPATLGRDLAALIQSGYRLHRLQLVDMFPQTHHLETIATLHR
ncbi:MAG: 23S rRNA (uracil(1939)-C(5))-methyltransferase RlmD [Acidobacteriaceae bacterium]